MKLMFHCTLLTLKNINLNKKKHKSKKVLRDKLNKYFEKGSLAVVSQILCHSIGYERLQKSKHSLKALL